MKRKTYPFIRYTSKTIYKLRISCQAFYILLTYKSTHINIYARDAWDLGMK